MLAVEDKNMSGSNPLLCALQFAHQSPVEIGVLATRPQIAQHITGQAGTDQLSHGDQVNPHLPLQATASQLE